MAPTAGTLARTSPVVSPMQRLAPHSCRTGAVASIPRRLALANGMPPLCGVLSARGSAAVNPLASGGFASIPGSMHRSKHLGRTAAAAIGEAEAEPQLVELPKNFSPDREQELYEWWESKGFFKPEINEGSDMDPFVVSMPPPNVTGALHMGHAMFSTLEDILVRFNRMRGAPTLWLPGTDHAGIATQLVVEKQLAAEGTSRLEIGREEFERRVWEWKEQYGGRITTQLRRLGASCDWTRERFTLDATLSSAVLEAFTRLHDEGLIYRGSYLVNWAPKLMTAVSDLEVEYSEEEGKLYFFKYPVAGGEDGEHLPVATTRPETILGDTAVCVHPEDPRYKHLIGKECVVPMVGRKVPIIADEYVDMEFGTGALKITPAHDPNDYELGKKHDLEFINIMNKDGSMNKECGKYNGLDRAECRTALWADMEAEGVALKTQPHTLRVPRSQRGGEVVEPMVSEQWFVKMQPLADPALAAVRDGDIRILPERFEKVYFNWLDNIKDWCISRQLWWGHRIPVYYVFASAAEARAAEAEGGSSKDYVVAASEEEALEAARAKYGPDVAVLQDPDVLDTWFSSGLWPMSTVGWPNEGADDYSKYYPSSVMETGHDILFFWVARMIMMGIKFTGKSPFHTVFLHGLVRDGDGRKMSKSLGNVVDPLDTISEYGTDALRFTLATGTTPGQDVNLSMERVTANRNLTNKIWNAGKFVLFSLKDMPADEWRALARADYSSEAAVAELPLAERWVVSKVHALVGHVTDAQERYDFGEAGRALYDFFWGDFADWYIESSKTRLNGEDAAQKAQARGVLVYVFDHVLRLMHPFMPFVTEELWQALPHEGEALIAARWPDSGRPQDLEAVAHYEALQEVVKAVRNVRSEYDVPPKKKVPATVWAAQGGLREALAGEGVLLEFLGRLDKAELQVVAEPPSFAAGEAVQLVVRDGLEVFIQVSSLADPAKEVARLDKQSGKLQKDLDLLQGRLSNKSFVDKAPAKVVAEAQTKIGELTEQLATIAKQREQMQAMLDAK